MNISTRTLGHRAATTVTAGAIILTATLGLAACSAPGGSGDAASKTTTGEAATHTAPVVLDRAWAKAGTEGMTSAFGMLENHGTEPISLISAESDAAKSVELHEMAMVNGAMVMRELEGGLEIPAGRSRELAPGGEHLMLMGLTAPLLPGDEFTVTLHFSDGSSLDVVIPVRDTAGANEEYAPGEHDMGDDHEMDHDTMEHDSDAAAH